ncbi:MAG: type IV pilus biogenesis protein PilM [Oscillospiraceae bacterium]
MNSVYISNEKIQALCGAKRGNLLQIKRSVTLPLPDGCVLNGTVTDRAAFSAQLKQLAADNIRGRLYITVDSSAINTKRMTVPAVKRKKDFLRLLSEGFSDIPHKEPVYDRQVIGKTENGALDILACAAERSYIMELAEIFGDAGFSVGGIAPAQSAILRLVGHCKMLRGATFAVLARDGFSAALYLFYEGVMYMHRRYRLIAASGSSEYNTELCRHICEAVLFGKSDFSKKSSGVLLCGFAESELSGLKSCLSAEGMAAAVFPEQNEIRLCEGICLSDCIFAAANML